MNGREKAITRRNKVHTSRHFWLHGPIRHRHRRRRIRQMLYLAYRKGVSS